VQLVRARRMMASAALWTATPVASLASIALPQAFLAAGICIGAGYVAAGLSLLRERRVLALIPA